MRTTVADVTEIRLLGPVEVRRDDDVLGIGGPRQRRLLAALALHPNRVVSADTLVEVVFAGEPGHNSDHTLHTYVSRLRSVLGEAQGMRVVTKAPGYVLEVNARCVDTVRFERFVADAQEAMDNRDPAAAIGLIDDALALWHGDALGEFADEEWARSEVARLAELRIVARERRAAARLASGAAAEAVPEIERLIADEPMREGPRSLLMTALYRAGRQVDALRAYQDYRMLLADELGLDPSPQLRELERKVLEQDPSLAAPGRGASVRGYQLVEQIGTGAFSTVHRAVQTSVGREVAIKVIKAELADDPTFVRLFDREAQLVARLEHPHIVPLHDYWREPGGAYLVMRLMRGGSVERRLVERGSFSLEAAARLIDEIGEALALAHAHGVVHRDVKPANVLYDESDHAYLGDFGIALADTPGDGRITGLGTAGSPLYAAPEQLRDGVATPASDQYALAALVWELLTGAAPFEGSTVGALAVAKSAGPVRSLLLLRPDLAERVDHVLRTATNPDPAQRFADMGEMVLAFRAAAAGIAGATTGDTRPEDDRPRSRASKTLVSMRLEQLNPYKGLRAFDEVDAGDFFGRAGLVSELAARLRSVRLVAAVGPSGVGKSSVVRAGLLPALRDGALPGSEQWFMATMTPGRDPFAELEIALVRVATGRTASVRSTLLSGPEGIGRALDEALPAGAELLLVIDQFEELFTLCSDEDRRAAFLAAVVHAVTDSLSRVRVVLTLRADAYDRPLQYRAFAELVEAGLVTVMTPSSDELAEAITRPAERVGVGVEPGLIAQLINDVSDRPSALPLLQYALTELYERRVAGTMTSAAYAEIGGVSGALANRADAVYDSLPADDRHVVPHLFTSLLVVGERSVEPRRRVPVADVTSTSEDWIACERAIEQFAAQRLLSYDRDPQTRNPTVEIAHESLLRCWPRLAQWIDDDCDNLRMVQVLSIAATAWDTAGRDEADLLRGPRLAAAAGWAEDHAARLPPLQREFLDAARGQHEGELRSARRTSRRFRRFSVGLAVALVAALVIGVVALQQRNEATDAKTLAQRRDGESLATSLAVRSSSLVGHNPALALALAAESVGVVDDPSPESIGALVDARQAFAASTAQQIGTTLRAGDVSLQNLAFSNDGRTLITAGETEVRAWDLSHQRELRWSWTAESSSLRDIALLADGSVAAASRSGVVTFLDQGTGDEVRTPLDLGSSLTSIAVTSDGHRIAVALTDGTVGVWDLASNELIASLSMPTGELAVSVAFSPDGELIAAGTDLGSVHQWDLATFQEHGAKLDVEGARGPARSIAYQPAGGLLAAVSDAGGGDRDLGPAPSRAVGLWDARSGTRHDDQIPLSGVSSAVSFSPDGSVLAVSNNSVTTLWDVATGVQVGAALEAAGDTFVNHVAFSPDRSMLAIGAVDGTVSLWDRGAASSFGQTLVGASENLFDVAFHPNGSWFVTAGSAGITAWDAATLEVLPISFGGSDLDTRQVEFSPDGSLLASGGSDGSIQFWETQTGQPSGVPLQGHHGAVRALAFDPAGLRLASAGSDATVRLWDVNARAAIGVPIATNSFAVTAVDFDAVSSRFAVLGLDITMMDGTTGKPLWTSGYLLNSTMTIFYGGDPLYSSAVAPSLDMSRDGTQLVTTDSTQILLVDPTTGAIVRALCCDHRSEAEAKFSWDGSMVGTISYAGPGTARIWDPTTGRPLAQSLTTDAKQLFSVTFSPDRSLLVVTGSGGYVHVWPLTDAAAACELAAPYVTAEQLQSYLPAGREPQVCHFGSADD